MAQHHIRFRCVTGNRQRPGSATLLPQVNDGLDLPLDSNSNVTQDTVFELPVIDGAPPIRVTALAGTHVTFPPDVTDKRMSVARIATNRVPMVLEDGRATNLYISVQPSGAIFDQPLKLSFPNVDQQPPNASVLLHFRHLAMNSNTRYTRFSVTEPHYEG
jgi:hypothetical protein